MLGNAISDPEGLEGVPQTVLGLGLLDVDTVLRPEKIVRSVDGRHLASGAVFNGYEIHLGDTTGFDTTCRRICLVAEPGLWLLCARFVWGCGISAGNVGR